MSSSSKTANLKLNIWSGTDKPKREDFNSDNQKTEEAFNSLEKIRSGSYVGDGQASRVINFGFQPSAVFVAAVGAPGVETRPDGGVILRSGVASAGTQGFGVEVTASGFRVFADSHQGQTPAVSELNAPSVSYFYIAYK
ncbi:MAG TPA: hypothetical protein DEQ02_02155 [Ruminococcaceae bacterium]|nr:hypothetical protein [Oscillospiraceae bacterium]